MKTVFLLISIIIACVICCIAWPKFKRTESASTMNIEGARDVITGITHGGIRDRDKYTYDAVYIRPGNTDKNKDKPIYTWLEEGDIFAFRETVPGNPSSRVYVIKEYDNIPPNPKGIIRCEISLQNPAETICKEIEITIVGIAVE